MFRRFLGVFGVDAVVKASGVLFLPIYLSLMSQEAYASFSYITSLVGVLSLVCNFGLYVAQSKLLLEYPDHQKHNAISTINVLLALLLCVALLPLYAFGWDRTVIRLLFSGTVEYEKYRYLIPVGVILAVYAQMLLNFFLTSEQVANVQRYNIARIVISLPLTIGALYALTGDGATVRLVALYAAELMAISAFIAPYAKAMRGRFSLPIAARSLALGLPIMASGALGIVVNFSDKFFIERFCSVADLSVYFLGLTLAGAVTMVSTAFQSVWLPSFLKERDLAVNLQRTRHVGRILVLSLVLLSVAIWIAVALCVSVGVFKQAYASVLNILPILLASSVASSITGLLSCYTIYWNMTHFTILAGSVIAAISVPLNYFAVDAFGIYGVAATSWLANMLFVLIYLAFVRHRTRTVRGKSLT